MTWRRGIAEHGARRWFTVLAISLVVVVVLSTSFDLDLSRGSWHRYAVFGGLAVAGATALEIWRRMRGRHDE